MKKKLIYLFLSGLLVMSSCGEITSDSKLQQENDSLKTVIERNQMEMDENLAFLNDINAGFDKIREAENYITIQSSNPELAISNKERLLSDIQMMTETLQKNKQQLETLKSKLAKSDNKSKELQRTIDRMQSDIEIKAATIQQLQEDLEKKNIKIAELDAAVSSLNQKITNLSDESSRQKETLDSQDKTINQAWYAFGTSAELKKWGILTGGSLFKKSELMKSEISKENFIAVDVRNLDKVELFNKKAKILTTHPSGSYSLEKGSDGYLTLIIKDKEKFWTVSRYLVVEIN